MYVVDELLTRSICVVLFSTVFILGCLGTWGSSDDVMCDVMVSTLTLLSWLGVAKVSMFMESSWLATSLSLKHD